MGRFLGGIFGNTVGSNTPSNSISGIYTISGQYYLNKRVDGNIASVCHRGIVGTYVDGNTIYKYHIFNESDDFNVTELSTAFPNAVDYLIVGGGGGGGGCWGPGNYHGAGGGGGAGDVRSSVPGTNLSTVESAHTISSTGPYPVVIGSGGVGKSPRNSHNATSGGQSSVFGINAAGGGRGATGGDNAPSLLMLNPVVLVVVEVENDLAVQLDLVPNNGYPSFGGPGSGGGGGGAGGAAGGTSGGLGVRPFITSSPTGLSAIGHHGPGSSTGWIAGGGGGGQGGNSGESAGAGGGAPTSPYVPRATAYTYTTTHFWWGWSRW